MLGNVLIIKLAKVSKNRTLGSALLLAGTQIGAGMLALPLTTGVAGFFYALLLFIVCFLFMLISLFYLMEASLMSAKTDANLISIVRERLGPVGEYVAWVAFLFLLYAVAAAYLSGGGSLISEVLGALLNTEIAASIGIFCFLALFGVIIVCGIRVVDVINRLCVFFLFGTFLSLLVSVLPVIRWEHFSDGNPKYVWAAVPVVVLSFTSHIIIPSIKTYLGGDISKLKMSLLVGSLIPLVFYVIWELLVIGMLPRTGEYGLEVIGSTAHPIVGLTEALKHLLNVSWVAVLVGLFSFFALVTSFFGVSLGLQGFFEDVFHPKKTTGGRFGLLTLMFGPPLIFALFYPKGFILAIGYAGVFVAILYGILPVLMVWKGRYVDRKNIRFRVFGGKYSMLLMLIGSLLIIYFQIAAARSWLPALACVSSKPRGVDVPVQTPSSRGYGVREQAVLAVFDHHI